MKVSPGTIWFRFGIAALSLLGLVILYIALHPRHTPPLDDGTYPQLPNAEAPAVKR